jgi:Mg/Co/Ni transporter MgtE
MGNPVYDLRGERIGRVNDLGIATGEVFPRVTSLAIIGPGKTPFMLSWRKYVDSFDEDEIRLKVDKTDIRFSYLQPDEVLIARDLLDKQIVDTRGMRVVRVNDLKLSDTSSTQLRLLGAEVGIRGILRSLSPHLERVVLRVAKTFGKSLPERIIAWNYMDLIDRDLSEVKLSMSHKKLEDMHPADIADIIERLDPRLRGQVFAQLDDERAADAIAEIDEEKAAEIMGDLDERSASRMLAEMDPDDAAELVGELDYDKAEKLLALMGIKEQAAVRQLLGYREDTAGRIMTSEFLSLPETLTVEDTVEAMRGLEAGFETVRYVYVEDEEGLVSGVVSLNDLIVASPGTRLAAIASRDLFVASPDDDQEDVAENIAKYNLLAMPVVDDKGKMIGVVTVDDALDVLEEEHAQDLQIVGGMHTDSGGRRHDLQLIASHNLWFPLWVVGMLCCLLLPGADGLAGLALSSGLPIALVLADSALSYATNFFLEYDPDDEDAPSTLGFVFKGLGLGVVMAGLALIAGMLLEPVVTRHAAAPDATGIGPAFLLSFVASAVSILVSFAVAGVWLLVLRRRDEANKDTSGLVLAFVAALLALLVFMCVVVMAGGGVGIAG